MDRRHLNIPAVWFHNLSEDDQAMYRLRHGHGMRGQPIDGDVFDEPQADQHRNAPHVYQVSRVTKGTPYLYQDVFVCRFDYKEDDNLPVAGGPMAHRSEMCIILIHTVHEIPTPPGAVWQSRPGCEVRADIRTRTSSTAEWVWAQSDRTRIPTEHAFPTVYYFVSPPTLFVDILKFNGGADTVALLRFTWATATPDGPDGPIYAKVIEGDWNNQPDEFHRKHPPVPELHLLINTETQRSQRLLEPKSTMVLGRPITKSLHLGDLGPEVLYKRQHEEGGRIVLEHRLSTNLYSTFMKQKWVQRCLRLIWSHQGGAMVGGIPWDVFRLLSQYVGSDVALPDPDPNPMPEIRDVMSNLGEDGSGAGAEAVAASQL